jgi:hypothetical protein
MSGGYFDRSTYAMREIADTIERDIARALKPKPEKIQEDYWTIYEKDSFGSYHNYKDCNSRGNTLWQRSRRQAYPRSPRRSAA